MKILLCSYHFAPGVGGIETVGEILAENFARLGHQVRVVTESRGKERLLDASYEITRMPEQRDLSCLKALHCR